MKEIHFPFVLYRKAALPVTVLENFGSTELAEKISEYHQMKQIHQENTVSVISFLEEEIGKDIEDDLRKKLINIKRKIFNSKKIDQILKENEDLIAHVSFFDQIDLYRKKMEALTQLQLEIDSDYQRLAAIERQKIQEIIQLEGGEIRKSFKFIHETIDKKLDKYLKIPSDQHDKKLRKLDITLLKIITRAAAKTSPFSSLAYSGFDQLTEDETENQGEDVKSKKTVSKLNEAFLYRIFDKVLRLSDIYHKIPFQIVPTISLDASTVYWTALADDEQNLKKTYKIRDRLITLPRTESIDQVLEKFDHRIFFYQDFHDELLKQQVEEQEIQLLFQNLYEKDFIVPLVALPQNSENLLDDCIEMLNDFELETLTPIVNLLEELKYMLEFFDFEDQLKQSEIQSKVNQKLMEICTQLGLSEFDTKFSIYQDGLEIGVSKRKKSEYLEYKKSLSRLMLFFNMFNTTYLIKRRIAEIFYEKFKTDKIEMYDEWEEAIRTILDANLTNLHLWQSQGVISPKEFADEELNKLIQLKNDFLSFLVTNRNAEKIEIEQSQIEQVISQLPERLLNERQSNSFFVQKGQKHLVLNHYYEGTMKYFTRFLKQLPEIMDTESFQSYVRETILRYNFVDVNSTYGFNANNRVHLMEKEVQLLNTPPLGRKTTVSDEKMIDFKKLSIQYNLKTKLLDVYDGSEKVKVAFLGSLMPMMLPGVVSSLSLLSIDSAMYADFSFNFSVLALEQEKDCSILKLPEVVFDQKIVLSRKKWLLKTTKLEMLKKDVPYKIGQFAKEHELPFQCFVSGLDAEIEHTGTSKPQYIDFTSPSLIKLFTQITNDNEYVVLEEIDPTINQENYPDKQIEEMVFEITREGL